jgi:GMP synthase (glutamine-hydrolysing)
VKIAILVTGHIRKSVSVDYDVLLIEGMQMPRNSFEVFDLPNGDNLPDDMDFAGIVISGSSKMLTDGIDWLEETADWLRKQAEKNTPILGICFGHQLLAYAFGGKIADNPNGIEVEPRKLISIKMLRMIRFFSNIFHP